MRRLALCLFLLLTALPLLAQDAPPAINRALEDLSGRLDANIRLSDLDNWTYERNLFPDASMGCAQPGQSYAQVVTDGFRFSLTYQGITADYRVSADQRFVILCNTEALIELARPDCPPANDPAYLPARLRVGEQGRVTVGGLPNNLRNIPGTSGNFLGEIPPGETFTVLAGPECSQVDKLVWWQVDYKGLVGWTASGQGGEYWLEPLDGPAPVRPEAITAANAQQISAVPLPRNTLTVAALSSDGSKYATAVMNGVTLLFPRQPNVPGLSIGNEAIPTAETATTMAFNPDGDRLAVGYPDGYLIMISTGPGDAITMIWAFESGEDGINEVVFSPDGLLVATADTAGAVRLYGAQNGEALATLSGHSAPVVHVEFSADGTTLLSRDDSGIVILWQVGAGGDINFG